MRKPACIYEKVLVSENEISEYNLVLSFNKAFIYRDNNVLHINPIEGEPLVFELKEIERTKNLISFKSFFRNGKAFRYIEYTDSNEPSKLLFLKDRYKAELLFSMGSESPCSYGVNFAVTNENHEDFVNPMIINDSKFLQQLLFTITFAIENNDIETIISNSKILLQLAKRKPLLLFLSNEFSFVWLFILKHQFDYFREDLSAIEFIKLSNPLNLVDLKELNSVSHIPNIIDTSKNDLLIYFSILKEKEGSVSARRSMELFKYYALDLILEYHNKANGIVPKSIVEEISSQVVAAACDLSKYLNEFPEKAKNLKEDIILALFKPFIKDEISLYMANLRA